MGLNSQKQNILNALYKTGGVELINSEEYPDTFRVLTESDLYDANVKRDRLNKSVVFYNDILNQCKKYDFYPKDYSENGIVFVSIEEFMASGEKETEIFEKVSLAESLSERLSEIKSEKAALINLINNLRVYEPIKDQFSEFSSTKTTEVFFGVIDAEVSDKIFQDFDSELVDFRVLSKASQAVISVVADKSVADSVSLKLNEFGFSRCAFSFDCNAHEKIIESENKIKDLDGEAQSIYEFICKDYKTVKDFKLCSDFYSFEIEKYSDAENFSCTSKTFILEGYVPETKSAEVKSSVQMASDAVFIEFSEPKDGEEVPTLLSNNKMVKQAEFVTDLYSTPNYRELDPNKVVTFFFLLLMGIIMADIGYGLVMFVFGIALAKRIKIDNGARRLWYLIALGGISTMIFGALFNSLFGFAVLPIRILPNPIPDGSGIDNLMIVLVGCLALGIIQIAVGYFLKAINSFMNGDILDGILGGLTWVFFFIGFVLGAFNFLVGYLMPNVLENLDEGVKSFFNAATVPGLIILAVSLVLAAANAAMKERGFSKVSKFFGTFYGLINLMSDILSYARVFGLMLSGMIIAQTFNDIAVPMITGGGFGIIFGALVFLIGHVFNLAMGVLGAYIHVSRLHYIEFFSKFYTGEGNKFAPLGSDLQYVAVSK